MTFGTARVVIKRLIANPLIETLSQVIPDVFASCGRITVYPEAIPKNAVLSG